jgi:hypothetical protein
LDDFTQYIWIIANKFLKQLFQFNAVLHAHGGVVFGVAVILPPLVPLGETDQVGITYRVQGRERILRPFGLVQQEIVFCRPKLGDNDRLVWREPHDLIVDHIQSQGKYIKIGTIRPGYTVNAYTDPQEQKLWGGTSRNKCSFHL